MSNPYGGTTPPPPPNPYGAPHGYSGGGEPPKTDGVSIASLVLSVLCCTALIGVILGFVGLSRTKGGQRKGRGFAIAGLVLGLVVVLLQIGGGVALVLIRQSMVSPSDAEVGQCVNVTTSDDTIFLRKKDCSEEHDGEVVYVGEWGDVPSPPATVTTDEEAQKAVCSALVGAKAATFPKDLSWKIAFDEDDADDPAASDPFICYVESDAKLDKSLL